MSAGLASLLTRIQPAGVILFARNITGAEQTYKLLQGLPGLRSRRRSSLASTSKADGSTASAMCSGQRLPPPMYLPLATASYFANTDEIIGETCRALGIQYGLRSRARSGVRSLARP